MKRIEINTKNFEKKSPRYGNKSTYSNGFSFPVLSGQSNFNYHSTSTVLEDNSIQHQVSENRNIYSISVDWLEFICSWENPVEISYRSNTNQRIIVERISSHRNPNFRNLNRVFVDGVEVCDIFSGVNNGTHRFNEVSVRMANPQLYTIGYPDKIREVIQAFSLTFIRMARIDIALDGQEIMRFDTYLNKFVKSPTVQRNNDAIKILPTAFNKKEHHWLSWSIGSTQSGISARVYDKTEEITKSGKDYIYQYWLQNNIAVERVGRFEVQLNYKRLEKYGIDLDSLDMLTNAEFIGAIFCNEVEPWFKLFRVRKKDMMEHKKEVALKKGRELRLIKWNQVPKKLELLHFCDHQSNASRINAQRTISFTLREILRKPNTSTTAQTDIILQYANEYDLRDYTNNKIRVLFGNEIKSPYIEILKPLVSNGINNEKRG
ncbi:hypothetical protein JW887_04390 [Candidatus Dojkabacteria bacterium]|nr:hypothetical protein [Candidatus Dojkabacteria bacterium]